MNSLVKINTLEVIRLLIDSGASVNARMKDGSNPLMFSCNENIPSDTIQLIINSGSDVNIRIKEALLGLNRQIAYF